MRRDELKQYDALECVTEPSNAYQPSFDSPKPPIPITEDLTKLRPIHEMKIDGISTTR
jgi:hypothetical protein